MTLFVEVDEVDLPDAVCLALCSVSDGIVKLTLDAGVEVAAASATCCFVDAVFAAGVLTCSLTALTSWFFDIAFAAGVVALSCCFEATVDEAGLVGRGLTLAMNAAGVASNPP